MFETASSSNRGYPQIRRRRRHVPEVAASATAVLSLRDIVGLLARLATLDPRLRIAPAVIVLGIPAAIFVFNSFISMRERGFFDLSDLIAAAGFFVLAWMIWQRSRIAVYAGIILGVIYLVSAVIGGPVQFAVYWLVAIAALAESLRVVGRTVPAT